MKRCIKGIYFWLMARFDFLKLFHGVFIAKAFRREILSVYRGIERYGIGVLNLEGHRFRVRRNIHRLEKGLIMDPMKNVFALGYIQETIDSFEAVVSGHCEPVDHDELAWFCDVLTEYFSVTGSDPVIEKCERRFSLLAEGIGRRSEPQKSSPVARSEYEIAPVGFDDFYKLTRQRRSVRWYEDTPVPRSLVDQAISAAAQSPSACNRQPFEFVVIDTPAVVNRVSDIPMGTKGFAHQFPMIVVLVGKLEAFAFARDRHLIYIDASLAAMTFMLALETLGLSSCPINWPDIETLEDEMAKQLGLDACERPVMLISVGYAKQSGMIPHSHKKSLDQIRKFL
ncbi:nitroreductase family protein [Sulfuriroseicoccus oceanibius]|uniref:Nitroreductase family protein n=1 Tax=Sulfuriroseicoccus oceanibius TaxID=2707525 RepID=A0A7T7F001_9BACT|nr:nitroreductase family protein [Sulfuriroseicoccus oceanibius]QQL44316.1 nitroreductase family protein [Sulfuriroseicoccus oceanibius]